MALYNSDLTEKQNFFARECVKNGDIATKAYLKCYDVSPDRAENQITTEASHIRNHPGVSKEIERLMKDKMLRLGIDEQSLFEEAVKLLERAKSESIKETRLTLELICKMSGLFTRQNLISQEIDVAGTKVKLQVIDNGR